VWEDNLALNPKVRWVLDISAKNAVNAVLINSGLMYQWHFIFNFNNWPGVLAVLKATAIVIGGRELAIWLPKVLKWSSTGADPNNGPRSGTGRDFQGTGQTPPTTEAPTKGVQP
jgi:hypothetical protein